MSGFTGVVPLQTAAVADGDGNPLPVSGMSVVTFQVTGTFVAKVTFELTLDNTNWVQVRAARSAGIFRVPCVGARYARARVTWTSGTSVTVVAQACANGDESAGLTIPAGNFAAITPSNATNLTFVTRGIYVGVGGDISVEGAVSGTSVIFKNAVTGSVIPVQATRVNSTGTTATDLVGLY